MALQRIPWMVNGGPGEGQEVFHSAGLARQQTFQLGGDQTGIVGPDSLVVRAGETPGPYVTVGPGSGTIVLAQGQRNAQDRAYASAKDQSVGVRNDALAEVEIRPTTSAGGRVDALVVEFNDPEFEGTVDTTDFSTHEFVRFRVIRGAPRGLEYPWQFPNLNQPRLLLARIHIPASTATITDDMIEDIRQMSVIRYKTVPLVSHVTGTGSSITVPYTQESWQTVMSFTDISVPDWATRAHIDMDLGPLYNSGGRANGHFRVLATGQNNSLGTVSTSFVQDSGVYERFTAVTGGSQPVHYSTAGSTARLDLQIRRWGGSDRPGDVVIATGNNSGVVAKGSLTYEQTPIFDVETGI